MEVEVDDEEYDEEEEGGGGGGGGGGGVERNRIISFKYCGKPSTFSSSPHTCTTLPLCDNLCHSLLFDRTLFFNAVVSSSERNVG